MLLWKLAIDRKLFKRTESRLLKLGPQNSLLFATVLDHCTMDNSGISDYDYNLMCTENREFLYESEGIPGINPDFAYLKSQTEASKMANSDFGDPNQQTPTKTKRKRNSIKDKQRTEAEQTAYKKLKELIPSLRGNKRITKLQTIREACLYIENLQKTLTGIRKG